MTWCAYVTVVRTSHSPWTSDNIVPLFLLLKSATLFLSNCYFPLEKRLPSTWYISYYSYNNSRLSMLCVMSTLMEIWINSYYSRTFLLWRISLVAVNVFSTFSYSLFFSAPLVNLILFEVKLLRNYPYMIRLNSLRPCDDRFYPQSCLIICFAGLCWALQRPPSPSLSLSVYLS